ncbi:MAG TPA: hypothetical protein VEK80_06580 [Kribbellaceae bacterium]|jgi:hypothetical protein|nr:hypothetical protein [Kribbellaceae bacterium]
MSTKSGAGKMHIKPGHTIWAVNRPDGYAELLGGLPALARVVESGDEPVDVVHLFVITREQLVEELPKVLAAAPEDALVWISYPRREANPATDLNRNIVWHELVQLGWRAVSGVALDDTWSAVRGRPG